MIQKITPTKAALNECFEIYRIAMDKTIKNEPTSLRENIIAQFAERMTFLLYENDTLRRLLYDKTRKI